MAARKKPTAKKRAAKKPAVDKTDALVQQALQHMMSGHTMSWAAQEVGVSKVTLWQRLQKPEYLERYRMAQSIAAESFVQQAEDALNPDQDGALLAPHQVSLRVARAKQKLWLAGKLNPIYSERSTMIHEGSKEKPVELNVALSPQEAYQRMLSGK